VSVREIFFQRILGIKAAQVAAAARETNRAATAAPAQPTSTAALVPAATAAPAQPKPAPLTGKAAAYRMGCYCGPTSGGVHLIDDDPVTANWRATSNRPQPKYEPDTTDMSESNIVRLFEAQQVRVSKESK